MWKGKYSEKLVNNKIQELPEEYVIFNDLLFESNGYSTQIDHIVVSPYGVFVIETKGYKGWILGGENSEYWTQTIYKSKHQFYNPIKQNAGHVRFLRHLLKCSVDIPFIPIVVFNNNAELKVHIVNSIVYSDKDIRNKEVLALFSCGFVSFLSRQNFVAWSKILQVADLERLVRMIKGGISLTTSNHQQRQLHPSIQRLYHRLSLSLTGFFPYDINTGIRNTRAMTENSKPPIVPIANENQNSSAFGPSSKNGTSPSTVDNIVNKTAVIL